MIDGKRAARGAAPRTHNGGEARGRDIGKGGEAAHRGGDIGGGRKREARAGEEERKARRAKKFGVT